ncbi:hypothetical protein SO802_029489 [Lithocarpus litseifolius]|uniref:Phytocyanin domain-containing protein n=1 Tax=Lithocarpus litseifolius TaxID=425828 RepID=A0AAW2BYY4_9ROSI
MARGMGLCCCFIVVVMILLKGATAAQTYEVGDSLGWVVPPNSSYYSEWASNKTFYDGDKLSFTWTTGTHNVRISDTAAEYDNCSKNPAIDTGSPIVLTLNTSKPLYFFYCTVHDHCKRGQKFSINVLKLNSTTVAPPPSPSSALSVTIDAFVAVLSTMNQIVTILNAYSLIDHIYGSTSRPNHIDEHENLTAAVNPYYQSWRIRDKAPLSLINSTLTRQVFSLVVAINNAQEAWNTRLSSSPFTLKPTQSNPHHEQENKRQLRWRRIDLVVLRVLDGGVVREELGREVVVGDGGVVGREVVALEAKRVDLDLGSKVDNGEGVEDDGKSKSWRRSQQWHSCIDFSSSWNSAI